MIQLRWIDIGYVPEPDSKINVVMVNGKPCVLQFRMHFMPHLNDAGDITLKKLPEPPKWTDVEIA